MKMNDKGTRVIEEYQRYTSMEFFEQKRLEIARSVSDGLGIPLSEFEAGRDETAFFHWLTSLLAVEDWLRKTIFNSQDWDALGEGWEIARNKLAAAAALRLFHHRFALDIDDRGIKFINAFGNIAQANGNLLGALFHGWNFMRGVAAGIAAYWWENKSLPMISEGYFEELDETIDVGREDMEFLKNAYRDAIMQIATEFELLQKIQADGNIGLSFPDEMSEDVDAAGIIAAMKRYLAQSAVIRRPVSTSQSKVGKAISFAEAAESLESKHPKILVESVYDIDGGKEAFVYLPIHRDDRSAHHLLPTLTDAGLKVSAVGFSMF
jgi:hypothetical protein